MSNHDRLILRQKLKALTEHRLAALEKESIDERNRLQINIVKWRQEQLAHMRVVADIALSQTTVDPGHQVLYLPSDFSSANARSRLGIDHLARIEMQLWEGEAYDALRDVRIAVKHINGLTYRKRLHVREAGPNTRALNMINDAKR
jgi:hypothetical protein